MQTVTVLMNKSSSKMLELPDEIIDLTITSPPYGKIKDYSEDKEQIGNYEGDLQIEKLREVFKEVFRITKDGGFCAVNIGDYTEEKGYLFPFTAKMVLMMIDIGFKFIRNISWKKPASAQHMFQKFRHHYILDTEPILIFRKQTFFEEEKERRDFADKELLHNVWNITPYSKKEDEHIAIFPDELVKRLITIYTKEGDVVLDPFTGSGTVLDVAFKLNRHSIGYELNKDYCLKATEKISPQQIGLNGEKKLFFYGNETQNKIPEDVFKCLKK